MGGFTMNRRRFVKNILAGGTGFYLSSLPFELLANKELTVISILHTNDLHCHIEPFSGSSDKYNGKGGLARISQYSKLVKAQNPNTLLLDAGDMFQGTPYFNYFKGEVILKAMNHAGYDAGTIGNHEFDNKLEGIYNSIGHAQFPLICSNYDFSNTILKGKFPRYKVFEKSGLKIGLYGLGVELKGLVSESHYGKTIYNDPLKVALKMEKFLEKEKNCDLIICLSHLGHSYKNKTISDVVIAQNTKYTDLIIGGHTHTYMEAPLQIKNKQGEMVVVNQAWWGGLMLGRIDFIFENETNKKSAILANKINQ